MITATMKAVRDGLNRYLDAWRTGAAVDVVYLGLYGTNEAVLSPLPVWNALIQRLAAEVDRQATAKIHEVLKHGAGPQPTTILELTRLARLANTPVQVLQGRGMPRGSADLVAWTPALSDLRAIPHQSAAAVALRGLSDIVLDRAAHHESAAGEMVRYAVFDVDGFHAVTITYRLAAAGRRAAGRRGPTRRPIVELISLEVLRWFGGKD
ncbi:hypothetical protein ABZ671_16890 [Micromonospora sp. NPDC006766]|uniref:hypothetical protein n=1 Tax=Micromonospora sp. NPDC006766 TaxID=3154778 RepID=UPI0033FDEACF